MDKPAGDSSHLRKLVAEAEKAVADMKDPELKRVAFEKIMESLLSQQGDGEREEGATVRRVTRSSGKQSKERPSKKPGPKAYLRDLVQEGYFKTPRCAVDMIKVLAERGHHYKYSALTRPLQDLVQGKMLRRKKEKLEGKTVWYYSNW